MRLALVLALLGALPAIARSQPMKGPVAVMPFKNLNRDPKLDWLSVGMAETMLSDLKRGGRFRVVERDQVDQALAQMALDGQVGVAPSTAAKLGKIVGAKTIVLGAYQKYGPRIRITARFVQVETGLVLDTAEVTGKMTRIFRLQDRIVAHLLGREAPPRSAPERPRPSGPSSVKAYRLYSLSLTTSSSAQRVSYLKEAVKIDPSFSYALDDLKKLRETLNRLHEKSEHIYSDREADLRAHLGAAPDPIQARQLFSIELTARHFDALARDAHRLYGETSGDPARASLHEMSAYYELVADDQLGRRDLALQLGKRYLTEFPGGTHAQSVQVEMRLLTNARERQLLGKSGLVKLDLERKQNLADLAKEEQALARERAAIASESNERARKARATAVALQSKSLAFRAVQLDEEGCVDAYRSDQYQVAIRRCRAFLDSHDAKTTTMGTVHLLPTVRWYLVLAENAAGRFDDARRDVKPLLDDPMYGVGARALAGSLPSSPTGH